MRIKFLNLNIWLEGKLLENAYAFLQEQDADIVTLQEVYHATDPNLPSKFRVFTELGERLGYPYSQFAPGSVDATSTGNILQGCAVLSRFPIVESDNSFYDTSFGERRFEVVSEQERVKRNLTTPRALQHVRLDAGGTELNIFNTKEFGGRMRKTTRGGWRWENLLHRKFGVSQIPFLQVTLTLKNAHKPLG